MAPSHYYHHAVLLTCLQHIRWLKGLNKCKHVVSPLDCLRFLCNIWSCNIQLAHLSLGDRGDIYSYIISSSSNRMYQPILLLFHMDHGKAVFVYITIVQSMMCPNDWVYYVLKLVFVCPHATLSHYHYYTQTSTVLDSSPTRGVLFHLMKFFRSRKWVPLPAFRVLLFTNKNIYIARSSISNLELESSTFP